MKKIVLILLCFTFLASCSQLLFKVANAPTHSFEGTIELDIPYGDLDAQKLDIYTPKAQTSPPPVVIFFHGGRWTFGNKSQYKFVGMTLAELGYMVVIPNTRLYPEVKFPIFIEDAAKSIAWVHSNIASYGGGQELFVAGHSSGAHMAALIVADQSYLEAFGLSVDIINAFAGMSGPYDFEPKAPELKDMFGPPSQYPQMAVTNFIDGNEPPMLLIYTNEDETVHIRNLELLKAGIERANGKVETIIYSSGGHAATVGAFSWANPADLPVPEDIDRFFRSHRSPEVTK